MHEEIIIAGFGGQGILSAGRLLAYAGMLEDKHVSWLPSYGPEMRGGTANCCVIISDEPIGSPILNYSSSLVVMNTPSLEKFKSTVIKGGKVFVDSTLVEVATEIKDAKTYCIPASKKAEEMGNAAFANIVLLGKLISETGIVSKGSFVEALKKVLPEKRHYMIPQEIEALEWGEKYSV